ncbi:hypothetical protein ACTA71_006960 [Dictyostelium dimigraforme]
MRAVHSRSSEVKDESAIDRFKSKLSTKVKTESAIDRFKSKKNKKSNKNYKNNKDSSNENNNNYNNNNNEKKIVKKSNIGNNGKIKSNIFKKVEIKEVDSNEQIQRDKAKRNKELKYLEENKVLQGEKFIENIKLLEKTKKLNKLNDEILRRLSMDINKTSERVRCYRDRTIILKRLEEVIKREPNLCSKFGQSKIEMFGSSSTQLALIKSDVDIIMNVEREPTKRNEISKWCYQFSQVLRSNGFYNIKPIIHAKVPIVKFYDPKTDFNCDITLTKDSGNTRVVKEFCELSPTLSTLIIFCKNWASILNINDASQGTLSSYSITNMLIFVLQKKGILPSYKDIESFKKSSSNQEVQYIPNDKDIADLLLYFFKYFGYIFDYRNSMVNIYDYNNDKKEPINPEEELKFQENRKFDNKSHVLPLVEMVLYDTKDLFFIKDCVAGHNITRCVIRSQLFLIIKYFQKAYTNLISGKLP